MTEAIGPTSGSLPPFPEPEPLKPETLRTTLRDFSSHLQSMLDDPNVCDEPDFKERLAHHVLSLAEQVHQGLQSHHELVKEAAQLTHNMLHCEVSNGDTTTTLIAAAKEHRDQQGNSPQTDCLILGLVNYEAGTRSFIQELNDIIKDL